MTLEEAIQIVSAEIVGRMANEILDRHEDTSELTDALLLVLEAAQHYEDLCDE